MRKIGPFSKQILNYSYPPLLYQRGDDEEEEETIDHGECDEDEEDELVDMADSPGMNDEDLALDGQLPQFRDSDDEELIALGGALNGREEAELDEDNHLLSKLKRAAKDDNRRGLLDDSDSEQDFGIGSHATNLDGLDKDQILKMIDKEVDGLEEERIL